MTKIINLDLVKSCADLLYEAIQMTLGNKSPFPFILISQENQKRASFFIMGERQRESSFSTKDPKNFIAFFKLFLQLKTEGVNAVLNHWLEKVENEVSAGNLEENCYIIFSSNLLKMRPFFLSLVQFSKVDNVRVFDDRIELDLSP